MPSIENTPSVAISLKRAPAASRFAELRREVGHVVVAVAKAPRLAEADAVDDARVIQFVADHGILFAEQRLEKRRRWRRSSSPYRMAASVPRNAASAPSSAVWTLCVPQMKRTDANPKP